MFPICIIRLVARLDFRGCGTPESGPFGPNPHHETKFSVYFVTKSGPFRPYSPHKTPLLAHFVQNIPLRLPLHCVEKRNVEHSLDLSVKRYVVYKIIYNYICTISPTDGRAGDSSKHHSLVRRYLPTKSENPAPELEELLEVINSCSGGAK